MKILRADSRQKIRAAVRQYRLKKQARSDFADYWGPRADSGPADCWGPRGYSDQADYSDRPGSGLLQQNRSLDSADWQHLPNPR